VAYKERVAPRKKKRRLRNVGKYSQVEPMVNAPEGKNSTTILDGQSRSVDKFAVPDKGAGPEPDGNWEWPRKKVKLEASVRDCP